MMVLVMDKVDAGGSRIGLADDGYGHGLGDAMEIPSVSRSQAR